MTEGVFWLLPIGGRSLPEEELYASCLGELETVEINAYQTSSDRRLASLSRAAARVAASAMVGGRVRPKEWAFSRTTAGGRLLRASSGPQVSIGIADNEHILAICADLTSCVGVDVESWQRPLGWRDTAERFFSRPERDLIQRLPDKEGSDVFTMLWTGKEALAKANGAQLVDFLDLSLIGPDLRCSQGLWREGVAHEKWRVRWFDLGIALVAICCEVGKPCRIPITVSCDWITGRLSRSTWHTR
ncbi:MAG: 4'-phosphopantetheinyl transferase superfamily protein [Ramlibacter sp.]|nr:4'-phosphopantetheinyl transferase superfamily protein [Ramlibacter sp.]